MLTDPKTKELETTANNIRESIIEMLVEAGSGHTAGPLGMADIFTLLFFHTLNHDPKNPSWPDRDRLVLSNGHICPVYYATMAHAGYFPIEELKTLRKFGSRLQGHPHREFMPWLETSSGPLGAGLSQAVGMAIADRIDGGNGVSRFIYCLMSDGELDEGNCWEAIMLAAKEKLHNLVAVIDRNNIQIDGFTEDIILQAKSIFEKPTVIIAHTIPGKGVKEFERDFHWHGKPPSKDEAKMALDELRTLGGRIQSEHQ